MTASEKILLRNGLSNLHAGEFQRRDILIHDNKIKVIGENIIEPGASVVDCTNYAVVPGMVNAHYHSNGNFDRGRWDNLPLESYGLFGFPRLMTPKLRPEELYARTMLGAIEQLRTGVTCTVDFLSDPAGFTSESLGPVVKAYKDVGLRAVIAIGMNDRPYHETVMMDHNLLDADLLNLMERERPPPWDQWESTVRRVIEMYHRPDEGIAIGLAPSAPERCTDELLYGCAQLSDEFELIIHTHVLETRMQAVLAQERYGKTLPAHLHELGFLGKRLSFQHGIWLSEQDIELVADTGTTVVHNPVSNMKLGSGICPVPSMRRQGVNLALGSDAMSCNDSCNMYETLKIGALLHKLWDLDFEEWIGAGEAWEMATNGGAVSAGDSKRLGRIAEGAWADLVILDLNSHVFTPLNEPINQLVLSASQSAIDSVMIHGKWVLRDDSILGVNESEILEQARAIGPDLISRSEATIALAHRLVKAVNAGWRSARKQYGGVQRCISVCGS